MKQTPNSIRANVMAHGQFTDGATTIRPLLAYLLDYGFGQFGVRGSLAFIVVAFLRRPATLVAGIQQVISHGAQEEMVRSHARRIITMMADKKPLRNRAIMQLPRIAMGRNPRAETPAAPKRTIATSLATASPFPTTIRGGFIDIAPKPSCWWRRGPARIAMEAISMTTTVFTPNSQDALTATTGTKGMSFYVRLSHSLAFSFQWLDRIITDRQPRCQWVIVSIIP